MASELLYPRIITQIIVVLCTLAIFYIYSKDRTNAIAKCALLFFIFFSAQMFFRAMAGLFPIGLMWFFFHRLFYFFSALAILYCLGKVLDHTLRKYRLFEVFLAASFLFAYYDAYVLKGIAGEYNYGISGWPTYIFSGIILLLAFYYFNYVFDHALPKISRTFIASAILQYGLLQFIAIPLLMAGMASVFGILIDVYAIIITIGLVYLHYKKIRH